MRMRLTLLSTLVALSGCATDNNQSLRMWTPQGAPVNCINTNQIRSTHVVDDRTIHFMMAGGNRMMRNELPFACPTLGINRAFKYNSRTSQLCSVDTITVIQPGGRPGPRCGLGRFQPMAPATPAP